MVQTLASETSILKRLRLRWLSPQLQRDRQPNVSPQPSEASLEGRERIDAVTPEAPEWDGADLGGLGADLLAHCPDPTMVVDPAGRIMVANGPARDLGRSFGLPMEDGANIESLLAKIGLINGGGSPPWTPAETAASTSFVRDEGTPAGETIYDLRSTPRSGSDGGAGGWIVQLTEVTTLLTVRRERDLAVGHRDSMLKLLSHDMRSPQAAILATLTHPDLKNIPEKLRQIIERASRRTLYMVDSVVRLVRAESEPCVFEPIELAHIVEEVIDLLWSVGKSANVKFVFEPPPEEFVVLGDRSLLIQAVTDLFNNVVKYSGRGDSVVCSLTSAMLGERAAVTCEVVDRVRHLSDGELARMFSRFAPTDESDVGSMGDSEGFMFLKAVVGRHSGNTVCENLPGGGRRILVTLPLAPSRDFGTGQDKPTFGA